MNLSLRGRIERMLGEKSPMDYDAFSEMDKTMITMNTPIVLVMKNIKHLLKERRLSEFKSLCWRATINCCRYICVDEDANHFYNTICGCLDFGEEIEREVSLNPEWVDLIKEKGFRKIGIITKNYDELTGRVIKNVAQREELKGISLKLVAANEIQIKDGRFTSDYRIKVTDKDGYLKKLILDRPFIYYDNGLKIKYL